MRQRRRRTVTILLILLGACAALAAAGGTDTGEEDAFERMHRAMRDRTRRILFNNDGCDALYYPSDRDVTPQGLLDVRTSPLAGTHVDTLVYCTLSSGFGYFTHRTEAGDLRDSDWRASQRGTNAVPALLQQGTDPLQVMIEFCRKNDMEIFWSMRMNDVHDASHTPANPHPNFSPVKQRHPEFLMGTYENRPPYGNWSAVDYTHPEIRNLAFRYIEEVCRNYDIDGIEMDFLRHPHFFRSVCWGGRASGEEQAMMTDLLRRVRRMTAREGRRRGRPILILVRVFDDPTFSRCMGLDIESWMAEDLVDMVSAHEYWIHHPYRSLVELGHRYGVKVYPGLSRSSWIFRGHDRAPFSRVARETFRAESLRMWTGGADGIYLFNVYDASDSMLSELGDPDLLARLDKTYFVNARNVNYLPRRWMAGGDDFIHAPQLGPGYPLVLMPGLCGELELELAEDPSATARRGSGAQAHLYIRSVLGTERECPLTLYLNGMPVADHAPWQREGAWWTRPLPLDMLQKGNNVFRFVYKGLSTGDDGPAWPLDWQAPDELGEDWFVMGARRGNAVFTETREQALLVADRGTEPGDYLYLSRNWGARPGKRTVAEVEMKVISGWNGVILSNGETMGHVHFHPDAVVINRSGLRYEMDTTDAFHTYRFEIRGNDLLVHANGRLILDGTGTFTRPAPNRRNSIQFGASNSPSTGEALWRAVRADTAHFGLADLALDIRFATQAPE